MSAGFLEGDFDLPATDEPGEDIARTDVEIGSQEGLRLEFAFGIANEQASGSAPAACRRDTRWRCHWRFRRGGWFGRTRG